MNEHLGDSLHLYALGALDDAERATVEAHVATCAACATELGEAEAVIVALDDAYVGEVALPPSPFAKSNVVPLSSRPRPRLRPAWYAAGALAAAMLFGFGFGTEALFGPHGAPQDDGALATIAGSHFLHVSLTTATNAPGTPAAKVLYARDGSWLYAIVNGPAGSYRFRMRDLLQQERVDPFTGDGAVGTLFENGLKRPPVAVDLIRTSDGAIVASATIVYPAKPAGSGAP